MIYIYIYTLYIRMYLILRKDIDRGKISQNSLTRIQFLSFHRLTFLSETHYVACCVVVGKKEKKSGPTAIAISVYRRNPFYRAPHCVPNNTARFSFYPVANALFRRSTRFTFSPGFIRCSLRSRFHLTSLYITKPRKTMIKRVGPQSGDRRDAHINIFIRASFARDSCISKRIMFWPIRSTWYLRARTRGSRDKMHHGAVIGTYSDACKTCKWQVHGVRDLLNLLCYTIRRVWSFRRG